jgi:hypothetical protein
METEQNGKSAKAYGEREIKSGNGNDNAGEKEMEVRLNVGED